MILISRSLCFFVLISWPIRILKPYVSSFGAPRTWSKRNQKVKDAKWVNPDVWMYKAGVIMRDHKGLVMVSTTQPIFVSYSPQTAKAVAILHGIRFTDEKGLFPLVLESDAK
ncbi:hypothetical protein LWI29_021708 [Acer saccharum]|uniref:RNase H type-1 domain-containing protein n=1 Tax=Acer saccharum TaxID=4024 RepID=A0AA39S2M8_ACESA|nr:hypothetical protein LWI29_021708 [Acer saccharum]